MTNVTDYTHFFYFPSEAQAAEAVAELRCDLLTQINRCEDGRWLLRASGPRDWDDPTTDGPALEELAARHGGMYDGGESGWLLVSDEDIEAIREAMQP